MGSGNDRVTLGGGNDLAYGGEGDDVLVGNAGADRLFGGEGNDVLNGGTGDDLMSGGEGADRFVFVSGRDVVTDFENGDDDIDLRGVNGLNSWADVSGKFRQVGDDVHIVMNSGRLILEDTRVGELDRDDFMW